MSIGNPIWRDLGFVNQCTRPPREPVSPCLLAWTAPTGGHVCTCPRDRLSVSTGAPGVCIRRARAVSYARMCAMGARSVNRPAPSLDVREAHGLLRCMSNVACARQRQSARAEPSRRLVVRRGPIRQPRGHRRAASCWTSPISKRPPPGGRGGRAGMVVGAKEDRLRSGCRRDTLESLVSRLCSSRGACFGGDGFRRQRRS